MSTQEVSRQVFHLIGVTLHYHRYASGEVWAVNLNKLDFFLSLFKGKTGESIESSYSMSVNIPYDVFASQELEKLLRQMLSAEFQFSPYDPNGVYHGESLFVLWFDMGNGTVVPHLSLRVYECHDWESFKKYCSYYRVRVRSVLKNWKFKSTHLISAR